MYYNSSLLSKRAKQRTYKTSMNNFGDKQQRTEKETVAASFFSPPALCVRVCVCELQVKVELYTE